MQIWISLALMINITNLTIFNYTERRKGAKIGSHIHVSLDRAQRMVS